MLLFTEGNNKYLQYITECPAPVNVLAVVIGVVVGTVVLGILLLLIWKIVTTILDKRELARFENERQNAKWQAVSTSSHTDIGCLFSTLILFFFTG